MEGLLKILIGDKQSISGDFFFFLILMLLSTAIISGSVISFILRISIYSLFIRFIREKKVWLYFPHDGHPQISSHCTTVAEHELLQR